MTVTEPPSGATVVALLGELDVAIAAAVEARLLTLVAQRPAVRIDLDKLTFLDSTGLRALLHVSREARRQQCDLRLQNAGPPVRRLLELTGLTDELPLE
jgi:anti-anti-sigma factor